MSAPLFPPLFLGHEIYRQSSYGPRHPLAIQRIPLLLDTIGILHRQSRVDHNTIRPRAIRTPTRTVGQT